MATVCSAPPEGRKRWTLDLLAGEMVGLTEHEALSRETVRRRLAEDDLKPWRRDMWCIPQVDGTTLREWKTCSTSMLRNPIRRAPWFASMKARHN